MPHAVSQVCSHVSCACYCLCRHCLSILGASRRRRGGGGERPLPAAVAGSVGAGAAGLALGSERTNSLRLPPGVGGPCLRGWLSCMTFECDAGKADFT